MRISDFCNKKVLVMGLGIHGGGLGVAKFFSKAGAKVTVTDLRSEKELNSSIKALSSYPVRFVLGRHEEKDFFGSNLIIQNPAVSPNSYFLRLARKAGVDIETEMSVFIKLSSTGRVIGVTGTKGKTTTTLLIGEILKRKDKDLVVAGNLRVSVLDKLFKVGSATAVVLELSSFQLAGLRPLKFSPKIAVVTSILRDHLNRYPDFPSYISDKRNILLFQKRGDFAVLPKGLGWGFFEAGKGEKLSFSSGINSTDAGIVKRKNGSFLFLRNSGGKLVDLAKVEEIKLRGRHALGNILASSLASYVEGADVDDIRKVIKSFKGVEHRLEFVKEISGVAYYNDTCATIPDASMAAISSFPEMLVLILGGNDKNLRYTRLANFIGQRKQQIRGIVLLKGNATDKMHKAFVKRGLFSKVVGTLDDFGKAVAAASKIAKRGDVVILTPGATSFNMFTSEFERGEKFKSIVEKVL